MNPYATIHQFATSLRQLDAWLEKAGKYAESKPFDVEVLAVARLAPDQFPLTRQVQSACDAAKFAAAYLSGNTAPSNPDVEKTIPELRQRIQTTLTYLATFKEADFAGFSERKVSAGWMRGKWVTGEEYLVRIAVPNFHFHLVHAYGILRHNGVPLGKSEFLGPIDLRS
jgi:hypothetical protein